ncbi:hypothetical protein [Streptomyces sp. NPDC050560]|uniref:hypothetical protein n=1 Tax=Streptomyces sp. NPDC050560 TaxID=3365630 RepID=UPI0037BD5072
MAAPVFEEFEPATEGDCRGRAYRRPAVARRTPIRPGARRALVLAAVAAGTVLGPQTVGAAAAAKPEPARQTWAGRTPLGAAAWTPQGPSGPLYGGYGARYRGPGTRPVDEDGPGQEPRTTTRADIMARASAWVDAKVPYDMNAYWSDGYRQDCSGFVSMAWGLGGNEWTGSLPGFADRITKDELAPGDILLFHNEQNPEAGSHATIFGGWQDESRTRYLAYEMTPPNARKRETPYAYWSNSERYVPYRYKGVVAEAAGPGASAPWERWPGHAARAVPGGWDTVGWR